MTEGQSVLKTPQLLKARGLANYHRVLLPLPPSHLIENFYMTASSIYLYVKHKEHDLSISQEASGISIYSILNYLPLRPAL